MAPLETTGDSAGEYLGAWSEIARAMESGTSWSGHERNVAYLNTRDGRFADVSTVTGLDHVDDGRVALRCDWDRDGDEDLWLRFRSGPTLRYMENQADPARYAEVIGAAPGAVAEVTEIGGGRAPCVELRTSDGYLASPSLRRVLAVRDDPEFFCHWIAGEGQIELRRRVERTATPAPGPLADVALPTRIVLRAPLALPAERLLSIGVAPGRPCLVALRDPDCAVCESVLPGALKELSSQEDVAIAILEIGNPDDAASVQALSAVASSLLGPGAELDTPLSLLLDAQGTLQVLYVGGLDVDTVTQDAHWFALKPVQGAFRTTVGAPGRARWFHGMPRAYTTLIQELKRAGLDAEAAFYSGQRR